MTDDYRDEPRHEPRWGTGVIFAGEYSIDASADSIYFQPPIQLTVSLDGTVLITVARIANMARMPSLLDQGWLMTYTLYVEYHDDVDCDGAVIHASNYPVAQLNYKEDRQNVTATHFDARVRDLGGAIKCATVSPAWHGD